MPRPYHALIQTHHIISRRKISVIKAAAKKHGLRALIRSGGGVPGVMYVRSRDRRGQGDGDEDAGEGERGVREWVEVVRGLHYKDYRLVATAAPIDSFSDKSGLDVSASSAKKPPDEASWSFDEVDTVKEFGKRMEEMGVLEWWRKAMEYKN